ncbi:hypothetical protein F5880DRAFT_72820 [Lentinula raphanica]|nr:hypothetical protein F5880DRAFT_72820 [Lentinula raphanica]
MDEKKVAIFPASGKLGGSVMKYALKLLPARDVVLIARYPSKIPDDYRNAGATIRAADYDSPETLETVFTEVNILFLISYPTFQHERRTKAHKLAVDFAHKSGVKHIFYTSLAFAGLGDQSVAQVMQAHLDTERYLAKLASEDSSFSYTSIREGLYSESFHMYTAFFSLKQPTSEVLLPHDGSGPGLAWAKIDELGEASASLLVKFYAAPGDFPYRNQILLLSGPREWSLNETVQAFGRVAGKEVSIRQVSLDEYASQELVESRLTIGVNKWAKKWATVYDAIRNGETSIVTPLLKELLGREPEDFETTIRAMI